VGFEVLSAVLMKIQFLDVAQGRWVVLKALDPEEGATSFPTPGITPPT